MIHPAQAASCTGNKRNSAARLDPICGEHVPRGRQPLGEFRPQGWKSPCKMAQLDNDVPLLLVKVLKTRVLSGFGLKKASEPCSGLPFCRTRGFLPLFHKWVCNLLEMGSHEVPKTRVLSRFAPKNGLQTRILSMQTSGFAEPRVFCVQNTAKQGVWEPKQKCPYCQ